MRYGFLNNFSQTLAADLAAGATTMTLGGGGAQLADATTDYRYKLTLIQRDAFGTETHREIVDVTGAAGDDLTIVREQEATTQLSPWPSGTAVEARVTGGNLAALAPELIAFGPVDFSDAGSSASWQAPPGRKLYVDAIEVVPSQSSGAGTPVLTGAGLDVALSPDGSLLAVGISDTPCLAVYNTADWTQVPVTSPGGWRASVDFSPDGSLLAVGHPVNNRLTVLNTSDWSTVAEVPQLAGEGKVVKFSPDGTLLAAGHFSDGNITVFNTSDWSKVTGPTLPGECTSLSWSHDGTRLAAGHWDDLTVFDTSDWSTVAGTPAIGQRPYAVAYNADSTLLAVGHGSGNTLQVFDTSDWSSETLPTMPSSGGFVFGLAWNPSDGTLAVGHDAADYVSILDPNGWQFLTAPELAGTCNGLVYTSDGATLIAAHAGSPYLTVAVLTAGPAPTLNLGTSAGAPDSLLAGAALAEFVEGERITIDVNHAPGVSSLYAEPASAEAAGAPATLVVRGYTLEA